jgi:signal transduction histidine kinase
MTAQVMVIGIGALTLVATAIVVAPMLFSTHLARTGEDSPEVQLHAEEAFASSFAISLLLATLASLVAAGLVSWFLVRRVAHPVAQLADAADAVAAGDYRVQVPHTGFSSEIVRLSEAFDHMATQLAHTETTRTSMLADLAHELRTPLATLEAYIDGMEDQVVATGAESWQTMRDQVNRLRRLATDLREAAAAEEHALELVLQPVDAGLLAEVAAAAARPRYQAKGVALELLASHVPAVVHADAERMQQVLANLLDNALRHTPAGGHVTVQVRASDRSILTQITDDGDGLATDELEAVFERFHRADPARTVNGGGGSGLGLTIARAIVTDHGGQLTAQSPGRGQGATLTLWLPAASQVNRP